MSSTFFGNDDDEEITCPVCGEPVEDDWDECPICEEVLIDTDEYPSDMSINSNGEQQDGSTLGPTVDIQNSGVGELVNVIKFTSEKIEKSISTLTQRIGHLTDMASLLGDQLKSLRDIIDDRFEQPVMEMDGGTEEREIPSLPHVGPVCDNCGIEMTITDGQVICPICDAEEPEERVVEIEDDEEEEEIEEGFFDEEDPPDYDIEAQIENLCKLDGVGPVVAQKLLDMEPPIRTIDDVIDMGKKKLRRSFGKTTVVKIMESAKRLKKDGG